MTKNLLLVDDNDRYAKILDEYFSERGYTITRARDAAEGLALFERQAPDFFRVIVTDITMETQLAGIFMLGRIKRLGYPGTVVVASTGFDVPLVVPLSRACLGLYGVHFLIPKTTVLSRNIAFYPMNFFAPPRFDFSEVGHHAGK